MKRIIPFIKMSAAGNDFVMVDNRRKIMPRELTDVVRKWCHRKYGVGGDGLIMLEDSEKADFRMRYYNADGSHASMCGNGGRSVARFACLLGVVQKKMNFETDAGMVHAEIVGDDVRLGLYEPRDARLDFPITVEKRELSVSFINTGVPHVVVFVNDVEKADVEAMGRAIRYHRAFAPAGANVNFVQKKDGRALLVRTYERGVEGETLACGTGVTASAIIAGMRGMVKSPVKCVTRGGDTLTVSYSLNESGDLVSPVSKVFLEGPAEVTFTGEIEL